MKIGIFWIFDTNSYKIEQQRCIVVSNGHQTTLTLIHQQLTNDACTHRPKPVPAFAVVHPVNQQIALVGAHHETTECLLKA